MDRLRTTIALVDRLFFVLAGLLSLYMGVSTFVFLQQAAHHSTTLVSAIIILSGLLALRNVLREGQERRGGGFWVHLALVGLLLLSGVVSTVYVRVHAIRLQIEQPYFNDIDIMIGCILLIAVLLANWFHWGSVLTGVIAVVILYFFFGHLIQRPFLLKHAPYDVGFVLAFLGMNTTEGLFAYLADGVEKLYFLVLFSAFMIGVGVLNLVTELGKAVGRFVRGGAAFPAIVGSALAGMVMGAAVTNVAMTGKLTIPMMKRYGFKKEFAAAVEVAASTAGQIIPPVMGLAAFLMAALLNISYITVALVAVIPAFLYMVGVTIAVLIKARRDDLPKLREPIDLEVVFRLLPTFVIPMALVIVLLLAFYSPSYAGIFGIGSIVVLSLLQGPLRPSLGQFVAGVREGFEVAIQLSMLILAIGPLAQTFVTTNLAGRASALLVHVLPDNLLIMLAGAMVVTLFLGMGLPTPAAYVLVALTLGHFVQQLGVKAIPAHFFIQYFAVLSAVTPPVALASLAGAKIAGAPFMGTAVESLKLVFPTFFVPFAFIYHPSLLEFPRLSFAMVIPMLAVMGAQFASSVFFYGFLRRRLTWPERGLFALASLVGVAYLVNPDVRYFAVFVGMTVLAVLWTMAGARRRVRVPARMENISDGDWKR